MINLKRLLVCSLLLIMTLSAIIQLVQATTTNFTVHGNEEKTRALNLTVDDHVLISFTVLGRYEHTLYFSIAYPNGTTLDFGKTGDFHYSFVCDLEGEYVLHFSNAGSVEDKLVTLEYEIQHYIFGMPQMLFLTMVIVLICVVAVAVFIFMGKTH